MMLDAMQLTFIVHSVISSHLQEKYQHNQRFKLSITKYWNDRPSISTFHNKQFEGRSLEGICQKNRGGHLVEQVSPSNKVTKVFLSIAMVEGLLQNSIWSIQLTKKTSSMWGGRCFLSNTKKKKHLDCSSITTITSMFFTLDKGRLWWGIFLRWLDHHNTTTPPPPHPPLFQECPHLGCLPIHLRFGLMLHVHLEISNVMTKVFRITST